MTCLEIEFLAVGDQSRPGDAIVVRYGDPSAYDLMVVDGGIADTGERLVEHLSRFYPNSPVRHAVLTHSDADHASGLRTLLQRWRVDNLWLHMPWLLAEESRRLGLFSDKRWTADGLRNQIKREYDVIDEIVKAALAQQTNLHYPFAGSRIGPFLVLSPTMDAYVRLLPQFDKTPGADRHALESDNWWLGKASVFDRIIREAVATVREWIWDAWDNEQLRDGGQTSASNESSVVLYGAVGNHKALLTGDAGQNALRWAADYADLHGLPLRDFEVVQIPHHGSRSNVGPTILNRLIGPILPPDTPPRFCAYASAPRDDATHPRKMVLNAFIRRGASVYVTQGENKVYFGGFPLRPGYVFVPGVEFSSRVEAYS